MKIEIEKDIAAPPKKRGARPPLYPFRRCDVGDSFFVPDKIPLQMRSLMSYYKSAGVGVFQAEQDVKKGIMGTRIWRVE